MNDAVADVPASYILITENIRFQIFNFAEFVKRDSKMVCKNLLKFNPVSMYRHPAFIKYSSFRYFVT